MDDPVTMVLAREVVEGRLETPRRLVKGSVPYRVHLYLQPRPVGCLAELRNPLVRVVQDAAIRRSLVGLQQCGIR